VLPFENLSGAPDYFCDGLTEELITQLGRLAPARLGVIARTSAMQYRGTTKPANRIGRELGAGFLVEGTVRRDRERVENGRHVQFRCLLRNEQRRVGGTLGQHGHDAQTDGDDEGGNSHGGGRLPPNDEEPKPSAFG
jgi:hypothetical protein